LELYQLTSPLYRIRANTKGQFCGFYYNTSVELFELSNGVQLMEPDSTMIDSTFHSALCNGEGFLIDLTLVFRPLGQLDRRTGRNPHQNALGTAKWYYHCRFNGFHAGRQGLYHLGDLRSCPVTR